MILSAIAAMSRNRVIGKDNKLPWHLPEDLKYFKEKTKGKIMIMGRRTFDSIGAKPLPGRYHIVITRNADYKVDHPMVTVVSTLAAAYKVAQKKIPEFNEEIFIIGGGEIFTASLPDLNRLYLTLIGQDIDGDAYFPVFDELEFRLVSRDDRAGPPPYSFLVYERGS